MKRSLIASLSLLLLGTGSVWAQSADDSPYDEDGVDDVPADQNPEMAKPPGAAPNDLPPAPPSQLPAPPAAEQQQAPVAERPPVSNQTGQWVFTAQYGWVWMPYGDQYTYEVQGGPSPYAFVYYPSYGWRWLDAPWVWGVGVHPYFVYGPRYYGWYHTYAMRYGWHTHGYGAHWGGYYHGARWSSGRVLGHAGGHVVGHAGGGRVVHTTTRTRSVSHGGRTVTRSVSHTTRSSHHK